MRTGLSAAMTYVVIGLVMLSTALVMGLGGMGAIPGPFQESGSQLEDTHRDYQRQQDTDPTDGGSGGTGTDGTTGGTGSGDGSGDGGDGGTTDQACADLGSDHECTGEVTCVLGGGQTVEATCPDDTDVPEDTGEVVCCDTSGG